MKRNRDGDMGRDKGRSTERNRDSGRDRDTEENGDKDRGQRQGQNQGQKYYPAGSFPGVQHRFTHRGQVFLSLFLVSTKQVAGCLGHPSSKRYSLYISTTKGVSIPWLQIT